MLSVRNYSAHHSRLFNRVFGIKLRLSEDPSLAVATGRENRVFTQLTLIQYLHRELGLSEAVELPNLLATYQDNRFVSFERLGAPDDWAESDLWSV